MPVNVGFWMERDVTGNKYIFNAGYSVGGGNKNDQLLQCTFLYCFETIVSKHLLQLAFGDFKIWKTSTKNGKH